VSGWVTSRTAALFNASVKNSRLSGRFGRREALRLSIFRRRRPLPVSLRGCGRGGESARPWPGSGLFVKLSGGGGRVAVELSGGGGIIRRRSPAVVLGRVPAVDRPASSTKRRRVLCRLTSGGGLCRSLSGVVVVAVNRLDLGRGCPLDRVHTVAPLSGSRRSGGRGIIRRIGAARLTS